MGSLRLINALEIATFGDEILRYPFPPSAIVRDDMLDDVETIDVMMPAKLQYHQISECFFQTVVIYQ